MDIPQSKAYQNQEKDWKKEEEKANIKRYKMNNVIPFPYARIKPALTGRVVIGVEQFERLMMAINELHDIDDIDDMEMLEDELEMSVNDHLYLGM